MMDSTICIRCEGAPDIVCTMAEFVAANGECIGEDVLDALEAGEPFRMGGGAFPEFEIFPVKARQIDAP